MTDVEMKEYNVKIGGNFKFLYKTSAKNPERAQELARGVLSWFEDICHDMESTLDFESLDLEVYE